MKKSTLFWFLLGAGVGIYIWIKKPILPEALTTVPGKVVSAVAEATDATAEAIAQTAWDILHQQDYLESQARVRAQEHTITMDNARKMVDDLNNLYRTGVRTITTQDGQKMPLTRETAVIRVSTFLKAEGMTPDAIQWTLSGMESQLRGLPTIGV